MFLAKNFAFYYFILEVIENGLRVEGATSLNFTLLEHVQVFEFDQFLLIFRLTVVQNTPHCLNSAQFMICEPNFIFIFLLFFFIHLRDFVMIFLLTGSTFLYRFSERGQIARETQDFHTQRHDLFGVVFGVRSLLLVCQVK